MKTKRFLTGLALFLSAMSFCASGAVSGGGSILILGRTFYKGFPNIDPKIHQELNQRGIAVGQGLYSEISWEKLRQFKTLIFMAQPLPGTPEYQGFVKNIPLFNRFLQSGGGILIYRDRTSGGAGEDLAINLFLKDKGAHLMEGEKEGTFIQEENPRRVYWFDFVLRAYSTEQINSDHTVCKGVRKIWYPMHTNALAVEKEWDVLLRGSETSAFHTEKSPVILAARSWNGGRIALFPSISSYWTLEGYSPKWEGFVLEQGDGKRLLYQLLDWLGSGASSELGGFSESRQKEIFDLARLDEFHLVKAVPEKEQKIGGKYYKTLIGPEIAPENLQTFAEKAKEKGYSVLIVVAPDKEKFSTLQKVAERVSDEQIFVFPALKITDMRGNKAIALGGAIADLPWPPKGWKEPSLLAASVGAGAMTIWLGSENRLWSPSTTGAVSALELVRYDHSGKKIYERFADFRTYNSHDWFCAPIVVNQISNPDTLNRFHGFDNYIQAESLGEVRDALLHGSNAGNAAFRNKPLSQRLFSCYLGKPGIRIADFRWSGPGLSYDAWEGEYYQWFSSEDKAEIHVDICSEAPLKEVRLMADNTPIRIYRPESGSFRSRILLPSDNSSHSYWIEAENQKGEIALSSVLRSRSAWFWSHGGADRMQTYSNLFVESPTGSWRFHNRRLSFIPVTYFDLGWGNFMEKAMPPMEAERFSVRGIETGGPKGGLSKFQLPPFLSHILRVEGAPAGLTSDIGRKGNSSSTRDVALVNEPRLILLAGKNRNGIFGITPQHFQLSNRYSIYRFAPGSFEGLLMESSLKMSSVPRQRSIDFFQMNYKPYARQALTEIVFCEGRGKEVKREKLVPGLQKTIGPGGFWALYHDKTSGNAGMYVLDGNTYTIRWDAAKPALQIRILPRGKSNLKTRVLLAYSAAREKGDGVFFEAIAEHFNPEQQKKFLRVDQGSILAAGYPIQLRTENHLVKFEFSPRETRWLYPVMVSGVNRNWPTGIFLENRKSVDLLSTYDDCFRFVYDPAAMKRIYAGNLASAGNPEVRIQLLCYHGSSGEMSLIVHNPTLSSLETEVVNQISGKKKVLQLRPGEERSVSI